MKLRDARRAACTPFIAALRPLRHSWNCFVLIFPIALNTWSVTWYSCRCRGERSRLGAAAPVADRAAPEDPIANAVRARSAWSRLIYKVYEVDPLECPKCKGQMQVIALIDDPAVVRRILKHLNLW